MRVLAGICVIVCIVAAFHMPSSYYLFLRIMVCIGAASVAYYYFSAKIFLSILFLILLLLFNPVLPVYLHNKSLWRMIDIGTAVLFLGAALYPSFLQKEAKEDVNDLKAAQMLREDVSERTVLFGKEIVSSKLKK